MKLHWWWWRRRKDDHREKVVSGRVLADSTAVKQKRVAELLCRSPRDVLGLQRLIGNQALLTILMLEKAPGLQEPASN